MLNIVIQVIAVVIVGFIIYGVYIPYIYSGLIKEEDHKTDTKVETMIMNGKYKLNSPMIEFNTQDKSTYPFYKKLTLSNNINGGKQYTISFWLNKQSLNLNMDNRQFDLLLIGNNNPVIINKLKKINNYNTNDLKLNTDEDNDLKLTLEDDTSNLFKFSDNVSKDDYYKLANYVDYKVNLVKGDTYNINNDIYSSKGKTYYLNKPELIQKAPYIYIRYMSSNEIEVETKNHETGISKFNKGGLYLVIEFNTMKRFNNKIYIPEEGKLLSHFNINSAVLFTFVFKTWKDYISFDSGCSIAFYANDTLMFQENISDDSIMNNRGNIYIYPKYSSLKQTNQDYLKNNGFMADLRYFNYALEQDEIEGLYNKGYTNITFEGPQGLNKKRLMNKYYKLSLSERVDQDYSYI
jgi:hypothetical protein